MPVKLMSLEEAAAFLMMEPKELRALATSGEIPCIYQGSRMLFEHGELDTWYSNRLVTHQPVKHQEYAKMVPEEMSLEKYCRPELMEPCLQGKTKPAILRSLAKLAENAGMLYDPEEFLENIREREEVSSTAMAEGIALVHPQKRDEYTCVEPFVAIAKSQTPVFFGEPNGVPTDIFFLICSPDSTEHIQILGKVCQKAANPRFLGSIRNASTPNEMMDAVRE